jgi:hypothetical protein
MTIFAALFRSLPVIKDTTSAKLSGRDRLLFKFMDDNMEKINRLVEVRTSWQAKVTIVDDAIAERLQQQRKRSVGYTI